MRSCFATAAAAVFATNAGAATFTIVGNVPGTPNVGAASGLTVYGVTSGNSLFSMTILQPAVTLHSFAGNDGSGLTTPLALDSAGNITGIATYGGTAGGGTLWRQTSGGIFSVLHNFGAGTDGNTPFQGPVRDLAGNLYGATAGGAINTNGNAFSYSATGAYSVLHNFLSGKDGHCPFSGVAYSGAGAIYGTTVGNGFGGNPTGSVWHLTAKGALTTIHVFTDGADGEYPDQAPVLDHAGNLYGTTSKQNGTVHAGVIWKITAAGKFSVLHSFSSLDGAVPNGPLLLNTNGTLYGTTQLGGTHNDGVVFSITPAGVFTVLHSFTGGKDGANPTGGLAHNASGAVYGATATGQVFRIQP
jgi:uncharacterized repeat protein (TIGR03803 family)